MSEFQMVSESELQSIEGGTYLVFKLDDVLITPQARLILRASERSPD